MVMLDAMAPNKSKETTTPATGRPIFVAIQVLMKVVALQAITATPNTQSGNLATC